MIYTLCNLFSSEKFASIFKQDNAIHIVDVRKASEYNSQHISGAELAPLGSLDMHHDKFTTSNENFVHCAAGYRSVIAGSLLKKQGISNVINIEGGFGAIKETAIPLSDFICPTTL